MDEIFLQRCLDDENWLGSFYELALLYERRTLDLHHRVNLLQLLWSDPSLQGIVTDRKQFGQRWQNIEERLAVKWVHCYGKAQIPSGERLGCGSYFLDEKEKTWFVFYFPLGMLEVLFPVSYPLLLEENPWRNQIDQFLLGIARRIYQVTPFELASLGEEASALFRPQEDFLFSHRPGLLLAESLFTKAGASPYGTRSPEGLWWTGRE